MFKIISIFLVLTILLMLIAQQIKFNINVKLDMEYLNNYVETQIEKDKLEKLEFEKNKKELEDISFGKVVLR